MSNRNWHDETRDELDADERLREDRPGPVARPLRETVEVVRRLDEHRRDVEESGPDERSGSDDFD